MEDSNTLHGQELDNISETKIECQPPPSRPKSAFEKPLQGLTSYSFLLSTIFGHSQIRLVTAQTPGNYLVPSNSSLVDTGMLLAIVVMSFAGISYFKRLICPEILYWSSFVSGVVLFYLGYNGSFPTLQLVLASFLPLGLNVLLARGRIMKLRKTKESTGFFIPSIGIFISIVITSMFPAMGSHYSNRQSLAAMGSVPGIFLSSLVWMGCESTGLAKRFARGSIMKLFVCSLMQWFVGIIKHSVDMFSEIFMARFMEACLNRIAQARHFNGIPNVQLYQACDTEANVFETPYPEDENFPDVENTDSPRDFPARQN